MAEQSLVDAVKGIVASARSGALEAAYAGYRALFASEVFRTYDPKDQRQALRMMVRAVGVPDPPTPPMVAAYAAAVGPLRVLIAQHGEPGDYELIGICHVVVGDEQAAGEAFRTGLTLERERNVQSDLCGALMRRISML